MVNVEKRVIGNLLKKTDNIKLTITIGVKRDFFLYDDVSQLFDIIIWYYQTYGTILQIDALKDILQRSSKITVDLQKKILILFEEVKNISETSNFNLLLNELFQYHKINRLKTTMSHGVELITNNRPDDALKSIISNCMQIERDMNPSTYKSGFLEEDAQNILEIYADKKLHPEKYKGIMLGFPSFDQVTGGLKKGQVMIVMGKMKSGKSVWLTNVAANVVSQRKRVYYHVNEGGKELVQLRYLSCQTGIVYNHIRNATMSQLEEQTFKQYLLQVQYQNTNNLYIDSVDPANSSVAYIDEKLKELSIYGNVDLVLVDYLGLMQTHKKIDTGWERLGHIALELKGLAMKYDVPVIVLTHVNPEAMKSKGKTYNLEDMGLSKEPLKHVDMIVSWKIDDEQAFKLQGMGYATLSIQGSRDSENEDVSLWVNINKMKVIQQQITVKH